MVAVFTGLGAGFERGSVAQLGGIGLLGNGAQGRGGDNVSVNAATGNVLINRQDEFLVGRGLDVGISRTYNSLGALDENGDHWRQSTDRRVISLTGTVNTNGSTVKRIAADGSEVTYTYHSTYKGVNLSGATVTGSYRATDGSGAHDSLVYGSSKWTWSSDQSRNREVYFGTGGYIREQIDQDGNKTTFTYSGTKLTQITMASGGYLKYTWSGNNITSIETYANGGTTKTLTRTRYAYDSSNRLIKVTTDLSPENNSITDGKTYVTNYTYHGSTKRIASVTQTDGSRLDLTYDSSGRVYNITQTPGNGEPTRLTKVRYGNGYTDVYDPNGTRSILYYNSKKELTRSRIYAPTSGIDYSNYFTYDTSGNVTKITDAEGKFTSYVYDTRGNVIRVIDQNNITTYNTYDTNNNLTKVQFLSSRDSSANAWHYTRYVYDSENHLRYSISAEGNVAEYQYYGTGELKYIDTFPDYSYAIGSGVPTLSQMNAWRSGLADRSSNHRIYNLYDAKGQMTRSIDYGATTSTGGQTTAEGYTDMRYTYDSAGRLLTSKSTVDVGTSYVYDGLGRTISTTDLNGGTTTINFQDSATKTVITSAGGRVTTNTYNKAGDLISSLKSGSFDTTGTSTYKYDKNGRLRMVTDETGGKTYFVYDKAGNKTAEVDNTGFIQEFRYDKNGRQIAHARYTRYKATADRLAMLATLADPNNTLTVADLKYSSNVVTNHHSYDIWQWTAYDAKGQVSHTVEGDGAVTTYAYDNAGRLIKTHTYFNKLSSTQLANLRAGTSASSYLPAANTSKDSIIRTFYNRDGRVIGTLNAEGHLTKITYDKMGQKIQESVYANATSTTYRVSGTYTQLYGSFSKSSSKDIHVRYVYDGQGQLRFTIDALGKVTSFIYGTTSKSIGLVRQTIQHYATLGNLSNYKLSTVKSAVAALSSAGSNRNSWAVYNTRKQLVYSIDATGAVTRFQYDTQGNVKKTTQYANVRSTTSLPTESTMNSWAGSNSANARINRNYYTAGGLLRFSVDAEGYVKRFDYDNADRLKREIRWTGKVTPTDSWTTSTINSANKGGWVDTKYTYRADGKLSDIFNSEGERRYISYYANGEKSWDVRGYGTADESWVLNINDAAGRTYVTRNYMGDYNDSTDALNRTYRQTYHYYDGLGNLSRLREQRGNHAYASSDQNTYFYYNKNGQLTQQTNAEGGNTYFTYDAFGNVATSKDAKGYITTNTYDRGNRLTKSVDPLNYATDTTYTAFGEVATVKRNNATTKFTYDKLGRVTRVTDALNKYENFTLDAFGQRVTVRNKLGGLTHNTFDKRGQLIQERVIANVYNHVGSLLASEIINKFEYDSRGNQTKMIEAYGRTEVRTTSYVYDKADRVIQRKGDAVSVFTSGADSSAATVTPTEYFTHDNRGNLIESKDANGARTLYFYDRMDRVTHQISPEGTLVRNFYDANSNLMETRVYGTKVTLPSNATGTPPAGTGTYRRTTFTYDRLNRMTNSYVHDVQTAKFGTSLTITATSNDLRTQYVYDANGNVIKVIDPNGGQTFSYYDKLNRKIHQVDAERYRTTWVYNADGNVTQERRFTNKVGTPGTTSVPGVTASTYGDRITDFTYDKNGNRLTEKRLYVDRHNGSGAHTKSHSTISYLYNALGQVTKKTEATGDNITYTYDNQGRMNYELRTGYVDHLGGTVSPRIQYLYNGLNDVTRVFKYGKTGSISHTDSHYVYAKGGRLTSVTDGNGFVRTYRYDAKGQMVREEYARVVSDGTSYTEGIGYDFDKEGRVTAQGAVVKSGSTWSRGGNALDTVNTKYNAYGDVSERGINGKYSEKMAYDKAGRLWRTTSGDGAYKYFMYDNNGNQTLVMTSNGDNIDNKTIAQVIAKWGVSSSGANANRIWTDYETGVMATITKYDARNLAIEVREPERQYNTAAGTITRADFLTKRSYNAFGDVISETDANNKTINYTYNTMGRRIKVQSPTVAVTSATGAVTNVRPTEHYYYDVSGRLVASRDANNNLTKQTLLAGTGYNGTQALISETTAADGGKVKTLYDIQGNTRKVTDQINRVTTNSFDKMGNLTQVNHANGLINYYAYDGLGQQIKNWNNVAVISSYYDPYTGTTYGGGADIATSDYDAQGRVVAQRSFGGDWTQNSYTWNGSLATSGLGTFGGWVQTTSMANGRSHTIHKDVFGHELYSNDLGSHVASSTYNKAGRLVTRSGTGADTQNYYYLNTGKVDRAVVSGSSYDYSYFDVTSFSRTTTYGYDKVGNLTSEKLTESTTVTYTLDEYIYELDIWIPLGTYTETTNITLQNARATYDALGRLKSWDELGTAAQAGYTAKMPVASKDFEYDAQGNIRRTQSTFRTLDAQGVASTVNTVKDHWYKFDSMNRVVTADGTKIGSVISRGSTGVDIAYDLAGQRKYTLEDTVSTFYDKNTGTTTTTTTTNRENYTYNLGGQISQVRTTSSTTGTPGTGGTLRSSHTFDKLGRQTRQIDYQTDGTTVAFDSIKVYNNANHITRDTTNVKRTDGSYKTITNYAYGSGASYAGAATTVTTTNYAVNSTTSIAATSRTTNNYAWYNGAVVSSTTYDANISSSSNAISTTSYAYSKGGSLVSARVADGRARTVDFIIDNSGQTIRRDEKDNNNTNGDPHEIWYRFGGVQMGYVGNNGTLNMDYSASITDRQTAPTTGTNAGAFRHGRTYGSNHADFTSSYEAINSFKQGSQGGNYTVRGGDTLQSIASNVYGDSSLWYKIAQANGLTGEATLIEGQALILPSGVVKTSHNAGTFKPYSPGETQGDLNPTTPHPQKASKGKKCGVLGQILLVVVAVAVTIATAGAGAAIAGAAGLTGTTATVVGGAIAAVAGSIASQVVGVATGIQEKFSWKGVALAAISGGVGAGLGGLTAFDKFGTFGAGAIKGALGSAISQGIGVATGLQETFSWAGVAAAGVGGGIGALASKHLPGAEIRTEKGNLVERASFANQIGSSAASAIASAATTSAINGSNFGDNLIAAIPNVIGQALGSALGRALHKGACFVGDTPVHTPNGVKPISDIKVGDWVYSRDENFIDSKVHVKRVIELYRFEDRATIDINMAFEDGSETSLRTTPEHPFAVVKEREPDHRSSRRHEDIDLKTETAFAWSTAAELKVGSRVIDIQGRIGLVVETADVGTLTTVHNFAVEDFHTYFVGNIGIWVHNEYTAKEHAEMIKRDAEFSRTVFTGGATIENSETTAGGRLSLLKMRDMELYEAVVGELGNMPAESSFGLGYSTMYASGVENFADLVPSLEASFQRYVQRGAERAVGESKFIDGFFDGRVSYGHIKGTAGETGKFKAHVFASGIRAIGLGTKQQTANPEVALQALGMLLGDASVSIDNVIGVFDSLNAPTLSEVAHNFFAVGGFIPIAGAVFDVADGLLYAYEDRPLMATLSFAAAVPGWGDAAKAGYLGKVGLKMAARGQSAAFKATEYLHKLAGQACFAAGTPVLTKEGLKPIEQLQEGDLVWSRSEHDEGECAWRKVLVVEATGEKTIYEVKITDASGSKTEVLRTTEEHPFWSETRGMEDGQGDFIIASQLKPGEQLRLHDGKPAYVVSVTKTEKIETVYNFTVDGFHTYHVGELGVWVHNQCLAAKIRNYSFALKMRTGMDLPKAQIEALKTALRNNDYTAKLTGAAWDTHKANYTRAQRNSMISQWEKANGRSWPRYANDVVNPANGKVVRTAGSRYDLHHIIEKQYGGPHTWWNSAPLHVKDHTFSGGIHSSDASRALFGGN